MRVNPDNITIPITALVYASESLVLAAKSTYLFILGQDVAFKVFKHQVIHQLATLDEWLVASGGRSISILSLHEKRDIDVVVPEIRIDDWIVDLHIVSKDRICTLLSHNFVLLFDSRLNVVQRTNCDISCIVYGGCIKSLNSTISCYSGTVFSELLYFEPFSSTAGQVLRKYSGHDGVIFDVDVAGDKVLSVSDDRTLIIWDNKSTACLKKLYYHSARVLKVLAVPEFNVIATGGEDSRIVFWCMETGNVLRDIKRNCGNNGIRSLAYHTSGVVCSGGWDGGITEFHVPKSPANGINYTLDDCSAISLDGLDSSYPKWVSCLPEDRYIICMSSGKLYMKNDNCVYKLLDDARLKDYSVVCKAVKHLIIGGRNGDICLLDLKTEQTSWINCKEDGTVWSVLTVNCHQFLTSQEGGTLTLWEFLPDSNVTPLSCLTLPPSKNCWVTCAFLHKDYHFFIVGTRRGGVYIYSDILKSSSKHPIKCYNTLHGVHGATQIVYFNNELVSVGNDGNFVVYSTHNYSFEITRKYKPLCNAKLIQKIEKRNGTTLIHYFYGKNYVVMNLDLGEVLLSLNCGGVHRYWDVIFDEKFKMSFINSGKVYHIDVVLEVEQLKSYSPSMHGSEIHDAVLLSGGAVITGGEDGDIIHIDGTAVRKYSSHISAVRSLSICGDFLFSGGGKGSLKVWQMMEGRLELVTEYSVQNNRNVVIGYPKSNHFSDEKGNDQKITSLDSTVSEGHNIHLLVGLSSGVILELRFDKQCYRIAPLTQYQVNNCVSAVKYTRYIGGMVKSAATTFGFLHLFSPRITKYKCHNSAINGLDIRNFHSDIISIATIGDNGDICLLTYDFKKDMFNVNFRKTSHFSAGIAISFVGESKIVSVGSDQRIVLLDCTKVLPLKCCYTDVCDPHSLYLDCSSQKGVIVGKGIQFFDLTY